LNLGPRKYKAGVHHSYGEYRTRQNLKWIRIWKEGIMTYCKALSWYLHGEDEENTEENLVQTASNPAEIQIRDRITTISVYLVLI
jgi:hypothetical protein